MLKGLVLALAIAWPHGVEVSSGAICRVVYAAKAQGDCEAATERKPAVAYFWRTCVAVEWAGRGPKGEDILVEKPVWQGESRAKAIAMCEQVMKSYEKVRKAR